ncbi:hypothetical protein [Orenia marismortui]|uniref:hypothetical protein n=1 Tax=Orenia marismortui TaxID=46469 RepID=UPI000364BF59|nr:hypothetical protein [Orenia marismortui]
MEKLKAKKKFKKVNFEIIDSGDQPGYLAVKIYNCVLESGDIELFRREGDGDNRLVANDVKESCDQGTVALFNIKELAAGGYLDDKTVEATIRVGDFELGKLNIALPKSFLDMS